MRNLPFWFGRRPSTPPLPEVRSPVISTAMLRQTFFRYWPTISPFMPLNMSPGPWVTGKTVLPSLKRLLRIYWIFLTAISGFYHVGIPIPMLEKHPNLLNNLKTHKEGSPFANEIAGGDPSYLSLFDLNITKQDMFQILFCNSNQSFQDSDIGRLQIHPVSMWKKTRDMQWNLIIEFCHPGRKPAHLFLCIVFSGNDQRRQLNISILPSKLDKTQHCLQITA